MLTPLPLVRRYLRRFSGHEARKLEVTLRAKMGLSKAQCSGAYGYCNAAFHLDDVPHAPKTVIEAADASIPHEDPRWPKVCDYCQRVFKETDYWQVFQQALYRRHTGEIIELDQAQPGDMWDAWWYPSKWKTNSDGLCLVVVLPGGHHWLIDRENSEASGWKRTGVPPAISVTPSVLVPNSGYHAWLRDGVLNEC